MVRLMGKLGKLGVLAYILISLAMLIWTYIWPVPKTEDLKTADPIVCLGGGMSANGTLATSVLTRI